jgi:hypothetical protein
MVENKTRMTSSSIMMLSKMVIAHSTRSSYLGSLRDDMTAMSALKDLKQLSMHFAEALSAETGAAE